MPDLGNPIAPGTLEQQRSPDFMSAPNPSPKPFEEQQVAPIPNPGTSVTEAQDYLARFNAQVMSAPKKNTPGVLPSYQVSSVYNPRYKSILPGEDSEEVFAMTQSPWKQIGNGLAKMGVNIVGAFADTIMTIPDTINAVREGKLSDLYNSPTETAVSKWMKGFDNTLPNYLSHYEQNHPFASIFHGGFSNFIGDKVLPNLGFVVGAIAGAAVENAAVGVATAGIGEIPGVAANIGKWSLRLNKLFSGAEDVEKSLTAMAMEMGPENFKNLTEEGVIKKLVENANLSAASRLNNYAKYGMAIWGDSRTMAAAGARDSYDSIKDDLLKDYQNKNGYSPIGKDLEDIETASTAAANTKFVADAALFSAGNFIRFDNLFKSFSGMEDGFRSSITKDLGQDLGAIGKKEGTIDEFEYKGQDSKWKAPKWQKAGADASLKEKAANVGSNIADQFKAIPSPKGSIEKIWSKIRPAVPGVVGGGILLGAGSVATQEAVKDYYENQYKAAYNKENFDTFEEMLKSTYKGLNKGFSSSEGLEAIMLNTITGLVLHPVLGMLDRIKNGTNSKVERDAILKVLNDNRITDLFSNGYKDAMKSQENLKGMKEAVEKGDVFSFKNFKHDNLVNYVLAHARIGQFDIAIEKLKMLKEMPQEEFEKAFGVDKSDTEAKKTVGEYVDSLIEKANSIKKIYDAVGKNFRNPYRFRTKVSDGDEKALHENESHGLFEAWKEKLVNYASIRGDVNGRLNNISKAVTAIHPGISLALLGSLGTKDIFETGKMFRKQASDIRKNLEENLSGNPARDRYEAEFFEKQADAIDALKSPDITKEQFGKTYKKVFENILNYHINSLSKDAVDAVPKERIDELMQYAADTVALKDRQEMAAKAYEALASEEGLRKYALNVVSDQERFAQQQKARERDKQPETKAKTDETGKPNGGLGTPEETNVTVKSKDGKEKTFEKGKEYFVSPSGKPEDAESIQVISQDKDGVLIQTQDGAILKVDPELLFAEDKVTKENTEILNEVAKEYDIPTNQVTSTSGDIEEEGNDGSKPDIVTMSVKTRDPKYSDQTTPDDHFQKRHQNFLYSMGSTNPEEFNQENRKLLRIVPVTAHTAEEFGFPKGWIEDSGDDADLSAIRGVYVIDKEDGVYFTDGKGNILGKVGEPVDPSKAIYTNLSTTELKWGDGKDRYTNKENVDEAAVQADWRKKREDLLAIKTMQGALDNGYRFKVSRGIPNVTTKNARNPVTKVGLVTEADFNKPIISVSTTGQIPVRGIYDDQKEGIESSVGAVNVPAGHVRLNAGLNMSFLDTRKFTPAESKNMFELIKALASDATSKEDKKGIFHFLLGTSYLFIPKRDPEGNLLNKPNKNSITIEGRNLYLGTDKTAIEMNAASLEANKDKITTFLEGSFHAVNAAKLQKIAQNSKAQDLQFNEFHVKDGKVEVAHTWPNYNHYLLSDKYPNGKQRTHIPLTSKINVPQPGEVPFIQKYSVIDNPEYNATLFPKKKAQEAKPKEEVKPQAPKTEVKKEPIITPEPKEEEGKVQHVTAPNGQSWGFKNPVYDKEGRMIDNTPVGIIKDGKVERPFKNPEAIKGLIIEGYNNAKFPPKTDGLDTSFLDDPNLGKPSNPQYSLYLPSLGDYEKADVDKEIAEAKKMLGDDQLFVKLDHVIRTTGGGYAFGAFANNTIYVWKQAKAGTVSHEVFEKVWGTFLTDKEQADLYNEFISRQGNFTNYLGQDKKYSEANYQEAKEKIADEFADHVKDPKSEAPPKAKSFFQRLIDFIKKILFGNKATINGIFEKIAKGHYRDFSTSERDMTEPQYSRPGLEDMSEALIQDTIYGMTSKMFKSFFKEGNEIISRLDDEPEEGTKEIYDDLKDKLTRYYEDKSWNDSVFGEVKQRYLALKDEGAKQELLGLLESTLKRWDEIKAKWPQFVNEHKRYIRQFGVEYEVEEGTIDVTGEDEGAGENADGRMGDKVSLPPKKSSSTKIKLLFATIDDSVWKKSIESAMRATKSNEIETRLENSMVLLPKPAPYSKLFNYALHTSANTNGLYQMVAQMKEAIEGRRKIDANLQRVINIIDFNENFKSKNINQIRLLLSLENTLSKQKPQYTRQFTDYNGNVHFKSTVLNSKVDQIIEGWTANMKASPLVATTPEGKFIFSKEMANKSGNIEFINKLGIDISTPDYEKLKGASKEAFNTEVSGIRSVVKRLAESGTPVDVLSGKTLDFQSRLEKLAGLFVNHITGDDAESQHPNLDNEQTTSFPLPNFPSTILADARVAKNREEFINQPGNEYFRDPFHATSLLLTEILFDKSGNNAGKNLTLTIVEGAERWDKDNTSTAKMNEAQRQLYEINNNLNGIYYLLLPADSKQEYAVSMGTFISPTSFFKSSYQDKAGEITKVANIMHRWLGSEIEIAKDYATNPSRRAVVQLGKPMGDRKVGNSLRFFSEILPDDVVNKINSKVIDGDQPLDSVFTAPETREAIKQFVEAAAIRTLENLTSWEQIIPTVEAGKNEVKYKLIGFDSGFLETHLGKKDYYTHDEVMSLLTFRELNYITSQIEMHKFFFGDPGQYKDELKRIKSFMSGREATHVDSLKTDEGLDAVMNELRNTTPSGIKLEPTDPGYHQYKDHFNTFTARDLIVKSPMKEEIAKVIGEKEAEPYDKVNVTDGHAKIMASAYREIMDKSGARFTTTQEEYYQWAHAWERQDKAKEGKYTYTNKELERADRKLLSQYDDNGPRDAHFQPIKLIHSGIQFETGAAIPSIDKASWAPMFYKWYKDRGLGEVYDAMQASGKDYYRYDSSHKVGTQSTSLIDLFDKDGKINVEGIKNTKDEIVSHKHIGVQVEQSKKEKGQTDGSQLRKLVTSNLMNSGVPSDFLSKYQNHEDALNEWKSMDENAKMKASEQYSHVSRYDKSLINLIEYRTDQTLRRLGITKDKEDYTIEDKKRISDFLLQELERRELPRNIALSLGIAEDGDFTKPLEANPQYDTIRKILFSVVESTVMRPKVNGGQKTMVPSDGIADLDFYKRGEDGRTIPAQAMISYPFGKELRKMGSERSMEEVVKHLESSARGRKLLTSVGFRIPTQGLNSMDVFTNKFLPEAMGDVIIGPKEITTKVGADYDIDKENVFQMNFFVNAENGFPELIEYKGSEEKTKEYLGKLVDEGKVFSAKQMKELEDLIRENQETLEFFKDVNQLEKYSDFFSPDEVLKDYLREGGLRGKLIDNMYKKALENEYFDSIINLLTLPENYKQLVTPNNADYLKGLRDELNKIKGDNSEKLSNYAKLLDSTFMAKERQAYMDSKGTVGIAAIGMTSHIINQRVHQVINNPGFRVRLPHKTIDGKISLSSQETYSGLLISNIISQIIDGTVDVTKDPFLAQLGINKDTMSTVILMVRMTIDPNYIVAFINQPIIKTFLKDAAINKGKTVGKLSNYQLLVNTLAKYGATIKTNNPKVERFTLKDMHDAIAAKELTKEQKNMQVAVLYDYMHHKGAGLGYAGFSQLAWRLFDNYQGYGWDTARINDPNIARLKQLKEDKANGLSLSPVSELMNNTFLGSMRDNTLKLVEGLSSVINVQRGKADRILDNLAAELSNQIMKDDDRRVTMTNAEFSMVDYTVQTSATVAGKPLNQFIGPLFFSKTNTAAWVKAMQSSGDRRLMNNPFIQALLPTVDTHGGPSTIALKERDYDTYTSNVLTDGFRELKDDASVVRLGDETKSVADIYKRMIITGILQSGSKRKGNSWSHLIPAESYAEMVGTSLDSMELDGYEEMDALYRSQWADNKLVPKAERDAIGDEEAKHHFLRNKNLLNSLREALKLGEKDRTPLILSLPEWRYRSNKAVKVILEERDANGKLTGNKQVRLFKAVDNGDGDTLGYTQYIDDKRKSERLVFKEINKWGDENIQEYYKDRVQSQLPSNVKVNEATDEQIIAAFQETNWKTNGILPGPDDDVDPSPEGPDPEGPRVPIGGNSVTLSMENNINFQEEQTSGYRNRTIKNASADATIALAVDFNSAGEKLTKSSVVSQGKKYIPIDINKGINPSSIEDIVQSLNSVNAKSLNIAGNGIYTMKGKYTQDQLDEMVYDTLSKVVNSPNLKNKIESIRTGGQTGIDEAGAKAAIKLGIPTTVLAPKGWTFRDISGKDISNEPQFKSRFDTKNSDEPEKDLGECGGKFSVKTKK